MDLSMSLNCSCPLNYITQCSTHFAFSFLSFKHRSRTISTTYLPSGPTKMVCAPSTPSRSATPTTTRSLHFCKVNVNKTAATSTSHQKAGCITAQQRKPRPSSRLKPNVSLSTTPGSNASRALNQ